MATENMPLPERSYQVIENPALPSGTILYLNGKFIVHSFADLDLATAIDLGNVLRTNETRAQLGQDLVN